MRSPLHLARFRVESPVFFRGIRNYAVLPEMKVCISYKTVVGGPCRAATSRILTATFDRYAVGSSAAG
ncbi:hypothetical protein AWB78_08736 [Caballeronia calidae]|uniref:Uncharacterized protein n=1 Tax=Caballeronia calidae TaxID=1777139 RepID=A0A158EM03_9BURK|nr:hypothetical protein AWB78_08713 [Caballeronia calidae]SAL07844.1 hypothetical protein AWB78_08736 [Caballeronia calidae]